jgi:predicted Zn-dependent protease with MMP-like domain
VEEALDTLPTRFRKRVHNDAVLVEDVPPAKLRRGFRNAEIMDSDDAEKLVLGLFEGVPATQKSVFDLPAGPERIVLYRKNIEAVCSNEDEIRKEIRLTVLHEMPLFWNDRSSTGRCLNFVRVGTPCKALLNLLPVESPRFYNMLASVPR